MAPEKTVSTSSCSKTRLTLWPQLTVSPSSQTSENDTTLLGRRAGRSSPRRSSPGACTSVRARRRGAAVVACTEAAAITGSTTPGAWKPYPRRTSSTGSVLTTIPVRGVCSSTSSSARPAADSPCKSVATGTGKGSPTSSPMRLLRHSAASVSSAPVSASTDGPTASAGLGSAFSACIGSSFSVGSSSGSSATGTAAGLSSGTWAGAGAAAASEPKSSASCPL